MLQDTDTSTGKEAFILILSVFIAGLCSIVYELLISTVSSYFLGDSIKHFSVTIGMYMAAMGIGAYFSRHFKNNLLLSFIYIEILLGLAGGLCIPVLYFVYAIVPDAYYFFMIFLILSIGILIGLEIPLLTRIMEKYYKLDINISNILSLDYLGALVATLIFPFILMPFIGTFRSSLLFGIINMSIGFMILWGFGNKLPVVKKNLLRLLSFMIVFILLAGFISADSFVELWSKEIYSDRVIFTKQTPYQKIVITRNKDDVRLFLNGNLQFSSIDEYRYHEPLVHVPLSFVKANKRVLILGGGDGLAARELLKHPEVEQITIVDLDPEITRISRQNNWIAAINQNSLENKKVKVLNQDAFVYIKKGTELFHIIIADLPDPNNVSLARLYSVEFYNLLHKRLVKGGVFVTQSTSPFFSGKAFWCIHNTLKQSKFLNTRPYHVYVPSFGDWGFIMASDKAFVLDDINIGVSTKFLDERVIRNLFVFEKDNLPAKDFNIVSTMDNPAVMYQYLQGWKYWN